MTARGKRIADGTIAASRASGAPAESAHDLRDRPARDGRRPSPWPTCSGSSSHVPPEPPAPRHRPAAAGAGRPVRGALHQRGARLRLEVRRDGRGAGVRPRRGRLGRCSSSAFGFVLPDACADLRIPISIILMNALTAFGGLLGIRVLAAGRLGAQPPAGGGRRGTAVRGGRRCCSSGAGAAGVMAVREIRSPGRARHGPAGVRGRRPAEAGGGDQRAEGAGVDRGAADARAGARDRPGDHHDRGRSAGAAAADPLDLRADPGAGADDPGDVRPAAGAGVDHASCGRCGSRTCCTGRRCRSRSTTWSGSWAARW